MKRAPTSSAAAVTLRRRAESRLRQQHRLSSSGGAKMDADDRRLLHELQVHQVELEMQNLELQESRDQTATLLAKYTDLYDFAPVGYLSLDEQGRILEANLTAAVLLGLERSRLIRQRLTRFVTPACRSGFLSFLGEIFAGTGKRVFEASLQRSDGRLFCAGLHGAAESAFASGRPWCRLAVTDITLLKRADALAAANRDLEREIVRRTTVELALKESESRQRCMLSQSRDMGKRLRQTSHRILRAQEDERKRISRELHDGIIQALVAINIQFETLARESRFKSGDLRKKIRRTQSLVEKSVQVMHGFARDLRPSVLDDFGLVTALNSFLKEFMCRTGITARLTACSGVEKLSGARRTALYRVAQEALINVARHARASRVEVRLAKHRGCVRMVVEDDGKSFDVEGELHSKRGRRLGLLGMKERMEMVGGRFVVKSAPGRGTIVLAQVPCPKARVRRRTAT